MEPWPFDTIPPDHIDALSDAERQVLEAIAQAYLAEIQLQRLNGTRPADPIQALPLPAGGAYVLCRISLNASDGAELNLTSLASLARTSRPSPSTTQHHT